MPLDSVDQAVSEKIFDKNVTIYVHGHGSEAKGRQLPEFYSDKKLLSLWLFAASYFPLNDFLTIFSYKRKDDRFLAYLKFTSRICRCILQCLNDIILKKLNDKLYSLCQERILYTVGYQLMDD